MFVGILMVLAGDWLVSLTTGRDMNMSSSVTVALRAYGTDFVSELMVLGSGEDGSHFYPNAVDEFKVDNDFNINNETFCEDLVKIIKSNSCC